MKDSNRRKTQRVSLKLLEFKIKLSVFCVLNTFQKIFYYQPTLRFINHERIEK